MINKKFNRKEKRGLPGGPNEQFAYVTGVFLQDIYHVPKAQNGVEKPEDVRKFEQDNKIGAYADNLDEDNILYTAAQYLPTAYVNADKLIMPLRKMKPRMSESEIRKIAGSMRGKRDWRKYAKLVLQDDKNLAQNNFNSAVNFANRYMSSPRYARMLENSLGDNEDHIKEARINNLKSLQKDVKYKANDPLKPYHDKPTVEGYSYRDTGDIYVKEDVAKDPKSTTNIHEITHSVDRPKQVDSFLDRIKSNYVNPKEYARLIPQSDLDLIKSLIKPDIELDRHISTWAKYGSTPREGTINYLTVPTEVRARILENLEALKEEGVDVFNKDLTPTDMEKIKNTGSYQDLKDIFSDESILKLQNTLSKNDLGNGQDMYYGQEGVDIKENYDWDWQKPIFDAIEYGSNKVPANVKNNVFPMGNNTYEATPYSLPVAEVWGNPINTGRKVLQNIGESTGYVADQILQFLSTPESLAAFMIDKAKGKDTEFMDVLPSLASDVIGRESKGQPDVVTSIAGDPWVQENPGKALAAGFFIPGFKFKKPKYKKITELDNIEPEDFSKAADDLAKMKRDTEKDLKDMWDAGVDDNLDAMSNKFDELNQRTIDNKYNEFEEYKKALNDDSKVQNLILQQENKQKRLGAKYTKKQRDADSNKIYERKRQLLIEEGYDPNITIEDVKRIEDKKLEIFTKDYGPDEAAVLDVKTGKFVADPTGHSWNTEGNFLSTGDKALQESKNKFEDYYRRKNIGEQARFAQGLRDEKFQLKILEQFRKEAMEDIPNFNWAKHKDIVKEIAHKRYDEYIEKARKSFESAFKGEPNYDSVDEEVLEHIRNLKQKGGEGYRMDAPGYNDPYKVIPSGNITMTEQDGGALKKGPLLGIDNMGNQQMMFPGYNYVFPGNEVMEIPVAQEGKGNFSINPFARAFPINEPEFRAVTGDIGIDTNIKNKPTSFKTSIKPTFGYSPYDPQKKYNLDLKGSANVGYRVGDFNTELGVQKNLMRSDDPQLQASLGYNNRKFGINASTNIPTKNNPNFFPRVDLRYSPNEKLTFTGDAEYDSITKSPRFNVGMNYKFLQEGGGTNEFDRILKKYTTKGWDKLTEEEKNFYINNYKTTIPNKFTLDENNTLYGTLPTVNVTAPYYKGPGEDITREGVTDAIVSGGKALSEELYDYTGAPALKRVAKDPSYYYDEMNKALRDVVTLSPVPTANYSDLMDLVEVAPGVGLVGRGAKKAGKALTKGPLKNAYNYNPFSNKLHEYNRIVAQDAVEDALKSNLIRTGKPKDYKKGPGIKLDRRGFTAYPSFGKKGEGPYDLKPYYNDILKRGNTPYIISTDRPMKVSTLGRHGKGSTMFPVDESGKYLKQFPSSEADIFNYQPHWLKGYQKLKQQGGEPYTIGDEVDYETMLQLKELGYEFE